MPMSAASTVAADGCNKLRHTALDARRGGEVSLLIDTEEELDT